jgi:mannitol/fructose-specific phosphotransferase system IIA component (Ntr-type)
MFGAIRCSVSEWNRVTIPPLWINPMRMAQTIGALLRANQIDLHLQAADSVAAIRTLTSRLSGNPDVLDPNQLFEEVLAREQLSCTALTHGVAVPHARTNAVKDIVVAVGRSHGPIAFGAEQKPVQLIFLIGTPPEQIVSYLAVVGHLARMLKDSSVRRRLLETEAAETFIAALR